MFVIILSVLTAIGLGSRIYRPPAPSGLPDDPGVSAARALLPGGIEVDADGLAFATSLGESLTARAFDPTRDARLTQAAFRLEQARARHRFDPRYDCLLGHLALAGDRLENAERRYRAALALAPRYGEARLGLGVTLARQAEVAADVGSARAARLEAIAQFAAVEENDRFHPEAWANRITLLRRVGRVEEARRLVQQAERGAFRLRSGS